MKNAKFILCLVAFAMASVSVANGAVIITATESQDGVLLAGSGSVNLLDLSTNFSGNNFSAISRDLIGVRVGPAGTYFSGGGARSEAYRGDSVEIPEVFGSFNTLPALPASSDPFALLPTTILADSGDGDLFGAGVLYIRTDGLWLPAWPVLFVPEFYVSGTELSGTAFFEGDTFESLGMTPGDNYTWTWGTGVYQDSLTFMVVPEPSAAAIMLLGLIGLIGCNR